MNRKMMVGAALAVLLMLPLVGCSSKGKLSAAKICAAAGGKYSMQTQTCDTPQHTGKKAAEMCQAHGGYYDTTAQVCEVGLE